MTVEPITFASAELDTEAWKFLLGAYGNDSLYIRQLVAIMRRHRNALALDRFRQDVAAAQLAPAAQRLADDRIALAEPYIDDGGSVSCFGRGEPSSSICAMSGSKRMKR